MQLAHIYDPILKIKASTKSWYFYNFSKGVKSRFIEMFGKREEKKYPLTRVANLVDENIVKVSKQYKNDDVISYVEVSSVDNDSKIITNFTEYIVGDAPSRAQQCVERGDILISTVRPNLQNVAVFDEAFQNPVCSSGFCLIRCVKCPKEFMLYAILDEDYTRELISRATGSSYPAVTSKIIMDSEIQLPPTNLQNKFADFVKQVDKSKFSSDEKISNKLNWIIFTNHHINEFKNVWH